MARSPTGDRGDRPEVPDGSPWRELPERSGPWQTARERHRRWSADGTWARLLTAAQADADAGGRPDRLVAADSSLVRVHQHGATARRFGGNAATAAGHAPVTGGRAEDSRDDLRIGEPGDHPSGRARGADHRDSSLADGRGRPPVLRLTAGTVNDTTMSGRLMNGLRVPRNAPGRPRARPDHLVADKGDSSRADRALLRRRGSAHTIPEPRDQQAAAVAPAAVRSASTGGVWWIEVDGLRDPGGSWQGGGRLSYRAYSSRPTTQPGVPGREDRDR